VGVSVTATGGLEKCSLTVGHRNRMTNASANPAMIERSKNTSSDPAPDFASTFLVSGRFIPVIFSPIAAQCRYSVKTGAYTAILSANRLSRMARFGKIRD
jgi:hypothetical protein